MYYNLHPAVADSKQTPMKIEHKPDIRIRSRFFTVISTDSGTIKQRISNKKHNLSVCFIVNL